MTLDWFNSKFRSKRCRAEKQLNAPSAREWKRSLDCICCAVAPDKPTVLRQRLAGEEWRDVQQLTWCSQVNKSWTTEWAADESGC